MFVIVTELLAGSLTVKFPGDLDPVPVHAAVPGSGLCSKALQSGDSSFPQTLPREDPDFNLCLIQPTAVGRRVMDSEPIPDFHRHFRTKDIRQCFAAMDVQVVQ